MSLLTGPSDPIPRFVRVYWVTSALPKLCDHDGWLRLAIGAWRQQGYCRRVIETRIRWVRLFLEDCARRQIAPEDHLTLLGTRRLVAGYVRARHGSWFPAFRNARSTLRAFSRALESVGVDVPAWQPSRTPDARDELLREYAAYRQRYRPLAQHTLMDEAAPPGTVSTLVPPHQAKRGPQATPTRRP